MPLSLLIAHGDETMADFVRLFYAEKGHAVETAAGGLECLAKLRQFQPDVLVLDRNLPWGGGDGVLARMREEGGDSMIPVVLICDDFTENIIDLMRAPITACVQKPFHFAQLLRCIQNAVSRFDQSGRGDTRNLARPMHAVSQAAASIGARM